MPHLAAIVRDALTGNVVNMLRENALVQRMQSTVTAYVRRESPFYEAQSVLMGELHDLIEGIAHDVRDEYGDIPAQESIDEQERRHRSVYAQLIIGTERQARAHGSSLAVNEIEKLFGLMCWMCDTAEDLRKQRSLPTALEAA